MSFRIEEKIPVSRLDSSLIIGNLIHRGATSLYPQRQVHSVYFDTHNKCIWRDSDEGLLPRKKIRIRHYPKAKQINKNLEIKISSLEGRFKTSKELSSYEEEEMLYNGYLDGLYGTLFPVVKISYMREYFSFQGVRITLDNDIEYSDFINDSITVLEPWSVIEIKAPFGMCTDFLNSLISVPRRRFSKFSNAMNALF